MRLELETESALAKSRIAFLTLTALNLRIMDNWRQTQSAVLGRVLDYESTMITLAVVAISSEHLTRGNLEPELQSLTIEWPHERFKKCNVASIAETTNLNRETVRRKVAQLVKSGVFIREDDGGIHLAPGITQNQEVLSIVKSHLRAVEKAVNGLIREKVFRVSAD